MTERKLLAIAVFLAGMALPGIPALILLWTYGAAKPLFTIIGAVGGSVAIGLIVRLVNRRGDSRYAKLPPDAP